MVVGEAGGRVGGFGELEAVVMARLWAVGGAGTVREVFEQLRSERDIAYTTVLSTMENLHRKGHLSRQRHGRAHRYRTVLGRAEHTAAVMRAAYSAEEDAAAVFTHFVGAMTPDELARLREVVARRGTGAPPR